MAEKIESFRIRINGVDEEINSIDKLNKANAALRKEIKLMTFDTKDYEKVVKEKNLIIDKNTAIIRNNSDAMVKQKMNIGNYKSALEGLPGPLGKLATSISNMTTGLLKFGPVGAIIGGGLLAISAPLVAFFTKSEEGIELLERKVAGFRASISILGGELIGLGKKMMGKGGEGSVMWGELLFGGLADIKGKLGDYFRKLRIDMDEASISAENYTNMEQNLEEQEIKMLTLRSKQNVLIKEARLAYAEGKGTIAEQAKGLEIAFKLENELADREMEHQKSVITNLTVINDLKKKAGTFDDPDKLKMAQAEVKLDELREASIGRQLRGQKTLTALKAKDFEATKKQLDDELAAWEWFLKTEKKLNDEAAKESLELEEKFFEEWEDLTLKDIKKRDDLKKQELEADAENFENTLAIKELQIIDEFELKKQQLENDRALELAEASRKGYDVSLIEKKYSLLRTELAVTEGREKLQIYAQFAGAVAGIFKEHTIIAKAAAVAEATINTYLGATQALKTYPPPLSFIAAAAQVAAGLAAVANIIGVKDKFESGGRIPGHSYSGDRIPILANSGEVVLNQTQQARLGGSETFRKIGVPGFAEGGRVSSIRPSIPVNDVISFRELARLINDKKVILNLNDLETGQKQLSIINTSSGI